MLLRCSLWRLRRTREESSNPWLLVNHVAVEDTVMTIKTAAAKHGGNHVEVFREYCNRFRGRSEDEFT